ncbi:MAG: Eco29kI family restriction endonuclease [Thermomicrobiales bacterium]
MNGRHPNIQAIIAELRQDLDRLLTEAESVALSASARRAAGLQVRGVVDDLGRFLNTIDPIRQPASVFDPGNPKVVGRFISLAMVAQDRHLLSGIEPFYGSGVYAIYYRGSYPLYVPLSGSETPIYVGQAAPAINNARTPADQGSRLWRRLNEHRRNIGLVTTTLDLDDFECRFLVVQSGWETAAEDYLIHLFRPIWNSEVDILFGLGKHGDDAKTRANKRSPWDTIHPGRGWAVASIEDARTPERIATDLETHFSKHSVFVDRDAVLTSFINELRQL